MREKSNWARNKDQCACQWFGFGCPEVHEFLWLFRISIVFWVPSKMCLHSSRPWMTDRSSCVDLVVFLSASEKLLDVNPTRGHCCLYTIEIILPLWHIWKHLFLVGIQYPGWAAWGWGQHYEPLEFLKGLLLSLSPSPGLSFSWWAGVGAWIHVRSLQWITGRSWQNMTNTWTLVNTCQGQPVTNASHFDGIHLYNNLPQDETEIPTVGCLNMHFVSLR